MMKAIRQLKELTKEILNFELVKDKVYVLYLKCALDENRLIFYYRGDLEAETKQKEDEILSAVSTSIHELLIRNPKSFNCLPQNIEFAGESRKDEKNIEYMEVWTINRGFKNLDKLINCLNKIVNSPFCKQYVKSIEAGIVGTPAFMATAYFEYDEHNVPEKDEEMEFFYSIDKLTGYDEDKDNYLHIMAEVMDSDEHKLGKGHLIRVWENGR